MDDLIVKYRDGLPKQFRRQAASIYEGAFGRNFSLAIPKEDQRVAILERCFDGDYAITAFSGDKLLGLAGLQTETVSFTRGLTYDLLRTELDFFESLRAALVLGAYTNRPESGELYIEGIAVHPKFRGDGIGGRLLDEVVCYASQNNMKRILLEVVDTNPRAQLLYERKGFQAMKTNRFPLLKPVLGFSASTTMSIDVG
jgi:ribosomal protein S18 acetylase RimI-like enzyme